MEKIISTPALTETLKENTMTTTELILEHITNLNNSPVQDLEDDAYRFYVNMLNYAHGDGTVILYPEAIPAIHESLLGFSIDVLKEEGRERLLEAALSMLDDIREAGLVEATKDIEGEDVLYLPFLAQLEDVEEEN